MIIAAWWGSGYLFAYTDDAYLTSDIVSITPEVSGPINAVHVTDNQWVSRGTLLFTIDPVPFQLALERARAQEAQAQAQLPIDQAQLDALQAEEEVAEAAASLDAANLNRQLPLGHSGAISAQTLDASRAAQAESTAHVAAARANISKARGTLRADQIAVASARASAELAE